jgi:hypothetical protein
MNPVRDFPLRRVLRTLALTGALAGCGGSSLGTGAWTWCKENLAAVDAAAATLQLPTVAITVHEPTWLADYQVSMANSSIALISANADFQASCNAAADAASVGASRVNWCLTDGVGAAWTSAESLGLMIQVDTTTFAYRGISLEKRLDNPEFGQACTSAYSSRTN